MPMDNIIWPVFKRYRELLDQYNLVEYQGADTFKNEIENLREYLSSLISTGTDVNGICIVARTNKLVSEYEGGLKADGLNLVHIETEERAQKNGIRIATMHRVKGLDFDHAYPQCV